MLEKELKFYQNLLIASIRHFYHFWNFAKIFARLCVNQKLTLTFISFKHNKTLDFCLHLGEFAMYEWGLQVLTSSLLSPRRQVYLLDSITKKQIQRGTDIRISIFWSLRLNVLTLIFVSTAHTQVDTKTSLLTSLLTCRYAIANQ